MNRYKYENTKEDAWFLWKGLKPPERVPHLTEQELEETLATNIQDHVCDWVQRGNSIECEASPHYTHGKVIGTKLRLAGTDSKGKPVLVPFGPVLRSDVVRD